LLIASKSYVKTIVLVNACKRNVKRYFVGSCDLAFMLDASDSLQGEANFNLCIEFIKTVFHAFGMGGGIRFALVLFASSAQVVFDFSKYSSISDLDGALGQVRKIDLKFYV